MSGNDERLREAIEQAVHSANLEDEYRPWNGECADIAMALYRMFGPDGVELCSVSRERNISDGFQPDHIFIEVDSTFIDGQGVQSENDFLEIFNLNLEFEEHFEYHTPDYIRGLSYYVQTKSEDIETRIERKKRDFRAKAAHRSC